MEAYNNTPTALTIEGPTPKGIDLKSGQTARFRFGSIYFKVKSGHDTLTYPRNIPFPGEYGPYYDGTLRIQIDPDGVIYALKAGEPPLYRIFPSSPMAILLRASRKAILCLPHAWMSYERDKQSEVDTNRWTVRNRK